MSNQIFRSEMPKDKLWELIELNGIKNEKCIIINNESYKRGIFNKSIPDFFELCKQHYHRSKQYYITRDLTYNTFITVLRQICNLHKIKYTSQIKYQKSKYSIYYFIYYE